ncbi:hypothetical protein [Azospirillum sp. B2RO_4]|uniref:hypothetical protein n=1 Tax=Azospirillum sp. B2RO_4 TaxID=3027796 RepID=UPI003DA8DACB
MDKKERDKGLTYGLRRHRKIAVDRLMEIGLSDISRKISSCSESETLMPKGRSRPVRCHHLFCPSCRQVRMHDRESSFLDRFTQVPADKLAMVTLLFQPHRSLFIDQSDGIDNVPRDQVAKSPRSPTAKFDIDRTKLQYSRLIAREFDEYVQVGGVEFEEVAPDCGPHKRAFVESFADDSALNTPVLVSHAHFVFAARRQGEWVPRDEIGRVLRTSFNRPFQVRVDPPKERNQRGFPMTKREAITGFLRYSMKGFSDFSDTFIKEVAEFDTMVTKHFFAFNRSTTAFRKRLSPRKDASPTGVAVIEPSSVADPMDQDNGTDAQMHARESLINA